MNQTNNALTQPGVLLSLLLIQAGILIPHWPELPSWIFGVFLACGGYRYSVLRLGWPLPASWLKLLLLVAVIGLLFASFGRFAGLDVAAGFLVLMLSLKLLEARAQRDAMLMVLLCYFLIATSFLFSQSLWMGIYLLLSVWATTTVLIGAQRSHGLQRAWLSWRLSGLLLLQALPLMALLFVLFPRLPSPLWQMQDPSRAKTGLSDSMSPEDVAELSESSEIAFRVDSAQGSQQLANRYWRALVYGRFDGRRWQASQLPTELPYVLASKGPALQYRITQEASQQPWLLALDWPNAAPQHLNARLSSEGTIQLQNNEQVNNRILYELESYPAGQLTQLSAAERAAYLHLPKRGNPRSREWAQQLRQQQPSDAAYVQALLEFIRQQPFYYNLKIAPIESEVIDGFWFERRRGFCAHYAGAFTFLLRSAGIPARVVGGYLGGEYNEIGNYLIVRQSQAHAWVEVWLEQHWQRIDPTSFINPSRVEHQLSEQQQQRAAGEGQLAGHLKLDWLSKSQLWFDSVNYRWHRWILGYDLEQQRKLLEQLGLANLSWNQLVPILVLGFVGCLAALGWWLLPKRRQVAPLVRCFQQLEQRLKPHINLITLEQPAQLLLLAAQYLPNQQQAWLELHQDYLALRYRPQTTPPQLQRQVLQQFRHLLKQRRQ